MKTLFGFGIWMTILMSASTIGAYAQNTFFPTKAGLVQLYERKNGSGKTEGFTKQTIQNVEGSGSNMTVSYVAEILDKNRKPSNPPIEMPMKVVIKNGVVILDMNQMFLGSQKTSPMKMEITGMPMELPNNLQAGQSLKDADVTMSLDMGIMKMKTVMKMTDGKCLAIEDVTVPAGTFKCHKITQTVTTTVMGRTTTGRTVSWYAPGIGTVKNESYDSKDKLQSSMELVEMN
jgi:hypothetical protein